MNALESGPEDQGVHDMVGEGAVSLYYCAGFTGVRGLGSSMGGDPWGNKG